MSSILWSVDTRDWADRNSAVVCNRAVSNVRSGSIILLHDIHPTSVEAVPCILQNLTSRGFRFVTVSQLLGELQVWSDLLFRKIVFISIYDYDIMGILERWPSG